MGDLAAALAGGGALPQLPGASQSVKSDLKLDIDSGASSAINFGAPAVRSQSWTSYIPWLAVGGLGILAFYLVRKMRK